MIVDEEISDPDEDESMKTFDSFSSENFDDQMDEEFLDEEDSSIFSTDLEEDDLLDKEPDEEIHAEFGSITEDFPYSPISLESCNFGDWLSSSLPEETRTKYPNLDALVKGLKENDTSLTSLSPFPYEIDSVEGFKKLCEGLKDNKTLTALAMNKFYEDAEGLKKMEEVLKNNTSLEEFKAVNDSIGPDSFKCICQGLEQNQTLQHLELDENHIGDEGIEQFYYLLKKNHTLTNFSARSNKLTKKSIDWICKIIKECRTLKELDISYNGFDEKGWKKIHDARKINHTLMNLVDADFSKSEFATRLERAGNALSVRNMMFETSEDDYYRAFQGHRLGKFFSDISVEFE